MNFESKIKERLNIVGVADVDSSAYLAEVEQLLKGWKGAKIAVKIQIFLGLSRTAVDYYQDVADEPTKEDQIKALTDIALIGWEYAKEKLGLSVPIWIRPMLKPAIEWAVAKILEGAVRYFSAESEKKKEK